MQSVFILSANSNGTRSSRVACARDQCDQLEYTLPRYIAYYTLVNKLGGDYTWCKNIELAVSIAWESANVKSYARSHISHKVFSSGEKVEIYGALRDSWHYTSVIESSKIWKRENNRGRKSGAIAAEGEEHKLICMYFSLRSSDMTAFWAVTDELLHSWTWH